MKVSCYHCDRTFEVRDEFAGKKIKCPKCGQTFSVPAVEDDTEDDNQDTGASSVTQKTLILFTGSAFLVGLLVGLVTGFAAWYEKKTTSTTTRIPPSVVEVPPAQPQAVVQVQENKDEWPRFASWTFANLDEIDRLTKLRNNILLNEFMADFQKRLRGTVGRKVTWGLEVDEVTDEVIVLKHRVGRDNHSIYVQFSPRPKEIGRIMFDTKNHLSLAKTLTRHDTAMVQGTIEEALYQQSLGVPSYHNEVIYTLRDSRLLKP